MSYRRTHLSRTMRRRASAEEGVAILLVLALLVVGLAVGAAALAETLDSRSHANLDARQSRALQAADFGVQAVLYRQNQLNLDSLDLTGGTGVLGKLAACVVPVVSGKGLSISSTVNVTVTSESVSGGTSTSACPAAKGTGITANGGETYIPIGNHGYYVAEFVPGETATTGLSGITFKPKIVSIGIDDNGNTSDPNGKGKVYARVEAELAPIEPFKTLEAGHNLTFNVTGATTFNGTARVNENVIFNGTGAFLGTNILGSGENVIGPASIDVGCERGGEKLLGVWKVTPVLTGGINELHKCKEPYFSRTPVSLSASRANCSNSLCSSLGSGYIAGRNGSGEVNSALSNQDEIYITNKATLTLVPGNDYAFCSFVTNGPVVLQSGTSNASKPVRIFIDSPSSARCKEFVKHDGIEAGSFKATQGIGGAVGGTLLSPTQLQIYLAGNGTNNGTSFESTGSVANAYFLYAPTSKVKMSALSFTGSLSGYDVEVSTLTYTQDVGLDNYPLSSTTGVFHVTEYKQCAAKNSGGSVVTKLTTTVATDTSGC